MKIEVDIHTVNKVVPLKTSGDEESHCQVGIIRLSFDGITGLGEVVPFSYYGIDNSWKALEAWFPRLKELASFSPFERIKIENVLQTMGAPSSIRAGIDLAIYDWLGKKANLPLCDILGLKGLPYPDTSLTIGINSPKGAVDRLNQWLKQGSTRLWKIKLGCEDGLNADKKMFESLAQKIEPSSAKIYVDANGGWSESQALHMAHWLQPFGVLFIEQPLSRGKEAELAELTENSPVPIFADESCLHSEDMQDLISGAKAGCDGINVKLTKCGGITEALRMITLARHHNLKVMLGCFSNTILGNSAAAQISNLVDYVDLDSHLNLQDDPFTSGAAWRDGRLIPNNKKGIGVSYKTSNI